MTKNNNEPFSLATDAPGVDLAACLLDGAPDPTIILDEEGKILFASARIEDVFGYGPRQLIGRSVETLLPERYRDAHRGHRHRFHERSYARPMGAGVELFALHADGREIPVEVSLSPVETAAGFFVSSAIRDISDRKRMENRIRDLMVRLEALASVAFDGIVVSENWLVREATERFAHNLGYRSEEITGMPVLRFVAPQFRAIVQRRMTSRVGVPFEMRLLKADGSSIPVEACGTTVTLNGRDLRISAFRDISSRRELEREVVSSSDCERHRIGQDLHDGLGQLLFGASLGLQGVCRQLEQTDSPCLGQALNVQNILQSAVDETRRVAHLLVPAVYGTDGLVAALRNLADKIERYAGVSCTFRSSYEEKFENLDVAVQLYRIAQESINNALKHGNATNIEMCLYADSGTLCLEILDDGDGIIDEQIEQPGGLGLKGMYYRARTIDANLEVGPRKDGGTRVLCACPL